MTNYGKVLEQTLGKIRASGSRPRLLLQACCAPCSSYTLEYLTAYFDITLLFYNPNIFPEAEYTFRASELRRFLTEHPACASVSLLVPPYDPAPFFEAAKGFEDEPERGARCKKCYRLRLEAAAKAARDGGYDYFCTTLSISPHKDAAALNEIGGELAKTYGVPYLFSDFKKKGGYLRSIELSETYHLYRQDYCGCIYSKAEAERRRSVE